MKAKIDADACTGCGLCAETCPEVFKMQDDKAIVQLNPVPEDKQEVVRQAADECPVTAIIIE